VRCTEPYVGLVAFGVGAVSVATVPLLAPEPELLQ
jgi:hypothetical protein